MITLRSPKTFTYFLAGSVVLIVIGVYTMDGQMTQIGCVYPTPSRQVMSLLGFDYRITSVGLDSIGYYDGCNYSRVSTISLLPEALGIVSFLTLVSYPATKSLEGIYTRLNGVLIVLEALGLLFTWFVGLVPGFLLVVFLGFTAVMRSKWGGRT
ncbi:hypothetical protein [Halococcus sp. IIIV-5B]|uniref:hypothetical protein n=1 Tax=Halococcus sp. IIIV-5B TaxID=2321230 RepID=UPI000E7343E1|nr:hypothetical protein [Halococcus sp. IIIV-5B]RJS97606.1 hypothetical protein D3261_17970 [Halococcus sp. IIIV-5B]